MTSAHLSPFDLERLRLGLLAPEPSRHARAHLTECARCQADQATLADHHVCFERDVWPRTVDKLRGRAEARAAAVRWGAIGGLVPVAVAAVLLVIARPGVSPELEDDLRAKGAPSLTVAARQDGRVFAVTSEARLRPGDQIRFVVNPGPFTEVLIASIDGAGGANVYFPYHGARSGTIAAHRRFEAPGSIVLDLSRGPERLFALFSHRPIDAEKVTGALRAVAARGEMEIRMQAVLPFNADAQASVLIEKEGP